jgi:copper transport protein
MTARFSQMAKVCVVVIVATGVYNAWLHMPSWSSFLTADYGRVLLGKIILLVPMLLAALINWKRVLPALLSFAPRPEVARQWLGRYAGLLRAETALGVAILALVAVLTTLPPASAVTAGGPATQTVRQGAVSVSLSLTPNKVGSNQAVVVLRDAGGAAIADARRVTIYLRSLDMDMGLETFQAQPTSDGNYGAEVNLSMAGRWLVSVEVSPARGDTFITEFRISSAM